MKDNRTIDKAELVRLMTEYGPLVAVDVVIQGKTEEEARQMFMQIMEEQNAELIAEQKVLKTRLETIRQMRAGDMNFAEGFDQMTGNPEPADSDTVGPPHRPINRLL